MKTFIISIIITITLAFPCYSEDNFISKFEAVRASGDHQKIQAFLKASAIEYKENPEYYVVSANYWWSLSQEIVVSTKKPDPEDISLTDSKSGDVAGSISPGYKANPKLLENTLGLLTEGAIKFPERIDISLGLAFIQKESGLSDDCVRTLETILKTAATKSINLKWVNGIALPAPPSEFLPNAFQDYSVHFFYLRTPEDDQRCIRLCNSIIKAYPDHPYAYNVLGCLATSKKHDDEALKHYLKANALMPDDTLILLNLGTTYTKLGQNQKARPFFLKVLNSDCEASYKKEAEQKLNQIK